MATSSLERLEFDRVLERLAHCCHFSLAQSRALEIGPSSDPAQVAYLQAVTTEAYGLLTNHPGFTVGGMRDVHDIVDRARHGSLLQAADLRLVLDAVDAGQTLRRSFFSLPSDEVRYPLISEFIEAISELPALAVDLRRTVGPRGEILSSASSLLAEIRHDLQTAHRRLLDRLNRMISESTVSAAIQDPIVTMRDGRYVIPVRADRRGEVPGVVHATSASGQTLFVEPMAAVEMNNRWRELQMAEEHEIERILRDRTNQIAVAAEPLGQNLEAVTAVDLALAKARLAFEMRARAPEVGDVDGPVSNGGHPKHRIHLRQARHPLLDPATVVPIDVRVGDLFRILIITGPNTGGKSVAIKTVGLLALMAQTGLYIPAAEGSYLSVFPAIYADIGDEQSIEQSLSTFSSHMTRVIAMLQSADADSLVLLDELGAGTDPQEGSALARSIIDALLAKGVVGLVTTHYPELKAYAYTTEGTENASVEFDLESLAPTYRLLTGVPGQSNALAIAARLGMPTAIIESARANLAPGAEGADVLVTEIRERLDAAEQALEQADRERRAARTAREAADEALREAEVSRLEARSEVINELSSELEQARRLVRRLETRSNAQPRSSERQDVIQEPEAVEPPRAALEAAEQRLRELSRRRRPPATAAPPIKLGDTVDVRSLGMQGEVVGFSDDGSEADVQVGIFKVRQPVAGLRRATPKLEDLRPPKVVVPAAPMVDQEIQLLGRRAADIGPELESYLDAASLSGLPWVRIVHGKGSGALRSVVQDLLRDHPLVSRFELAQPREGGDGVTVAYLKE